MSIKTVIHLIDDIDGSAATTQVKFSLNGKSYEIDLSDENVQRLTTVLEPYMAAGRLTSTTRARADRDYDPAEVRAWAQAQGLEVSPRGRIQTEVIAAWKAAQR